ncbi:MAG: hypothetical protein ACOYK9_05080 [Chlamydiia bacterium]
MFKKIFLLSVFSLFLHAEPITLVEMKKDKLYFKDGSVYRLSRESAARFPSSGLGNVFEVNRMPKAERKRSFDTEIKSKLGAFYATRVANKTSWRQARLLEKHNLVEEVQEKVPAKLSIVLQSDRTIKLSDGAVFEAQTLLPTRKIEGEEVSIEKVEFYQLKTKSGEKILLKQLRK